MLKHITDDLSWQSDHFYYSSS